MFSFLFKNRKKEEKENISSCLLNKKQIIISSSSSSQQVFQSKDLLNIICSFLPSTYLIKVIPQVNKYWNQFLFSPSFVWKDKLLRFHLEYYHRNTKSNILKRIIKKTPTLHPFKLFITRFNYLKELQLQLFYEQFFQEEITYLSELVHLKKISFFLDLNLVSSSNSTLSINGTCHYRDIPITTQFNRIINLLSKTLTSFSYSPDAEYMAQSRGTHINLDLLLTTLPNLTELYFNNIDLIYSDNLKEINSIRILKFGNYEKPFNLLYQFPKLEILQLPRSIDVQQEEIEKIKTLNPIHQLQRINLFPHTIKELHLLRSNYEALFLLSQTYTTRFTPEKLVMQDPFCLPNSQNFAYLVHTHPSNFIYFPSITYLEIEKFNISISFYLYFPNLKHLILRKCRLIKITLSDDSNIFIERPPLFIQSLEEIRLEDCTRNHSTFPPQIENGVDMNLASFQDLARNLKKLYLKKVFIINLQSLKDFPYLQEVCIKECREVSAEEWEIIEKGNSEISKIVSERAPLISKEDIKKVLSLVNTPVQLYSS